MTAVNGSPSEHGADPAMAEAEIAAVVLGSATEHTVATEDDLYMYRSEYYERQHRAKRVDQTLVFLFVLMVIFFFLLAWRTESNDEARKKTDITLANGLYNACVQRSTTTQQNNVQRETFIQLVLQAPTAPKDPVAKAEMARQLRAALLLPVEDCGEAPR